MRMRALVLKGATRRSESIGERKDVRSDQKVGVLGANRMPKHAISSNGDFRYQICARDCDAVRGKTTERDAADHPVLFVDLFTVQEFSEFGRLRFGSDRRGQPYSKSLRSRPLNAPPRFDPCTFSTMPVMALGRRAIEADLQCHPITRQ